MKQRKRSVGPVARCLEVTYRKGHPLAAYLYLGRPHTRSARTERWTPSLLVDFAASGEPIGVEILDPETTTAKQVNAVLRKLGLAVLPAKELKPLRAA